MAKRPVSNGPNSNHEVNADRQRLAVKLLREAGESGLTRENLAKDLNCSTRQVDRTMLVLSAAGAVLDKQRYARDGVSLVRIVLKKGPEWDEFITPRAMTALRIAMMALEQVGTEVWAEHLEAFERLTGPQLSTRDRIIFNSLVHRVRMNGTVNDPMILDPDVLAAVLTALGAPGGPLQLELTYTPPGRATWTRAVCPYCLTHDAFSGGAFLLVWDQAKHRAVHLRLNRIKQAKTLKAPAIIADEKPLEHAARYQIGGWVESGAPFEVEVLVTGRTWPTALLEAPPALPEILVNPNGKGARVRFLATEPYGPARWVLQFGPDAEVLHPEAVRDMVRQRLKEALAIYED
jgi:predicted DNA-binding transcriptional regulator YafY